MSLIPEDGVCESCHRPVEADDGYVLVDEDGFHRYCDDCPGD